MTKLYPNRTISKDKTLFKNINITTMQKILVSLTILLCLDPATWQGREYDNHSISLNRINPTQLNTDQWCQTAQLWGAKLILFVAKHTGGFCWWQTNTSLLLI